jgi:hypothetical protein
VVSDYPSHPGDEPDPPEQTGWGAQTGGQQESWGEQQPQWPASSGYDTYGAPSRQSGRATAALVLGIVGLFSLFCGILGICSILALIFGILSRNEINASGGSVRGGGMSMAGIILGVIGILATIGWIAVVAANN